MKTATKGRILTAFWISLVGYLLLTSGGIYGLFSIRASTLTEAGNEQARLEWKKWQAAAAGQDGTRSPVQRTAPKTDEPPLHMLMRDHFAATLVGLFVPLTALYWFMVWLVLGVMKSPGPAV